MRGELPWGGTIAARWKRKSQCHKKLGTLVDLLIYFWQIVILYSSKDSNPLTDKCSEMMDPEFSFPTNFRVGEKHVPTRNTRTDCCNPAVAADLGGSLWVTWQKGFGIPVPFRIEKCTICEAGAHSIWEVLAR